MSLVRHEQTRQMLLQVIERCGSVRRRKHAVANPAFFQALQESALYPAPPTRVEVRATRISVMFLTDSQQAGQQRVATLAHEKGTDFFVLECVAPVVVLCE